MKWAMAFQGAVSLATLAAVLGLRPQYIQFGYHPQTSNRANAFATPTWLIPTRSAICR